MAAVVGSDLDLAQREAGLMLATAMKHLRIVYQDGRDSWKVWRKGVAYDQSVSACNERVWTADTYSTPKRGLVTCPECGVFCDAWMEMGCKGRFTVRKVRALKRSLENVAKQAGAAR